MKTLYEGRALEDTSDAALIQKALLNNDSFRNGCEKLIAMWVLVSTLAVAILVAVIWWSA